MPVALGGPGIAAWLTANVGKVLLFAITTAASLIIAPRPPSLPLATGEQGRPGQQINTSDNRIPLPLIYGRARIRINRIYAGVSGADNKFLHLVGTLCEGEIEGIHQEGGVDQIFLGDKLYTEYGDDFHYEFFNGSPSQNVCATLNSAIPEWTDPLRYTAYIYCRFKYNQEKFQGLPNITVVVNGLKCYDPDTEVTAFTRNPAIQCRDFMTRSSVRGGMGISADRIDDESITGASAYCVAEGWHCDIAHWEERRASDMIGAMRATFRGNLIYSDSIFQLKYRDLRYESPVMHITEDDVAEFGRSSLRVTQPSIFGTPNAVRCRYISVDKKYTYDDFVLADPDGIASAGDYREMAAELVGMSIPTNVAKMAAYILERAIVNKETSLVMGTRGLALEPHDIVMQSHPRFGWDEKLFRVESVRLAHDGNVALQLKEEYEFFYDSTFEVQPETYFDTTLPSPSAAVAGVTGVSHAEEVYSYRGRSFTRWRVNFSRPALELYPWWDYAEVWVKVGDGEWVYATRSESDYLFDPVEEGETYYCKLVSVNIWGAKQAWEDGHAVSKTIDGQEALPPNPLWINCVAHGDGVTVYSPTIDNPDIFGWEVRVGPAWEGGIVTGFNETPNFRFTGVKPGIHTFWLKSLGNNGYYSADSASATVEVFYPPGYADKATWLWDYDGIGTHENTEMVVYEGVNCLQCAHTDGVLTGKWTSPEYDLTTIRDLRFWGDFITGVISEEGTWEFVFQPDDLWTDRIAPGTRWFQLFSPSTTGNLKAKLKYGVSSGNLNEIIENFEMFSPEVNCRFVQVEIEITDPALGMHFYVQELNMTGAFWRD